MRNYRDIEPKVHGESDRMSWNFYRFAKRYGINKIRVFAKNVSETKPTEIIVSVSQTPYSFLSESSRKDVKLLGKRLMHIFCSYGKDTTSCATYELEDFPVDITEHFFHNYLNKGRCYYLKDYSHKYNIWNEVQKDGSFREVRICEYCGHRQYKITQEKVVVIERWE